MNYGKVELDGTEVELTESAYLLNNPDYPLMYQAEGIRVDDGAEVLVQWDFERYMSREEFDAVDDEGTLPWDLVDSIETL